MADWLTLSQVAKILGVHPGTVRKWADKGHLPSHRTQGGHRRFRQQDIDLWVTSQRNFAKEGPTSVVRSALIHTRLLISEGSLETEKWYAKLDRTAREEFRHSGRKLMQSLMKFLASNEKEGQAEAHAAGYEYGMLGRRHGLSSLEATQAYLFFRSALHEALLAVYETAAIHSAQAWKEMTQKIEAFTNQVLISLLETYQITKNKTKK
ncbi:MAG TPA: helix-turn-helix domain-containing protein [Anaerolineales bacterium]